MCTGRLMSSYGDVQCCGGRVVSGHLVCCAGQFYISNKSKSCCGQQYVEQLTTRCCTDDRGNAQVCVCACSARSPCRVADQHYADLSPNWGLRYWVLSYLLGVLIGSQGSWYGLSFTRGRLHAGAMQILT